MSENKEFPEGMEPLGNSSFQFRCHPGVSCFTICCQKVDLTLYPYDVLRLKNSLGLSSEEFMRRHARVVQGDNPFFPSVMLQLTDQGEGACPFLTESGCTVYIDRPAACRTYPLERAVARTESGRRPEEFYFIVKHDYCKGHEQDGEFNVRQWVRDQRLEQYNTFNELWTEIDSLFRANPWKGEGAGGPGQQLAFMICYNIDGFRLFAEERSLFEQFRLNRQQKRAIASSDEELLKFGFEWLKLLFGGRSTLVKK